MIKNKNNKLLRIVEQSIKHFKLDLSGYNILLPASPKEPALLPLMASLAGAKNLYVASNDLETINKVKFYENELDFQNKITFIDKENPQILTNLDIVVKGEGVSLIDELFVSNLKSDCVISILPQDLDFYNYKGVNLEACKQREIPVIAVDPNDESLMLNKYLSNFIVKRCFNADLDIYKSKVLLVGQGELLENTLGLLKSMGAQVYAAYTNKPQDKTYIIKHLAEVDAIIVLDYPVKCQMVIGNEGFIRIEDLVDINPEVKIIHFAGKVDVSPLTFSRIAHIPDVITQHSLNLNIKEMGLKAITETCAAVLKASSSLIKVKKRTVQPDDSIVSYNVVNAEGPIVLGRITF